MSWATHYIARLSAGEPVTFRPRGTSVRPKIESGALVRLRPLLADEPRVGNIVLCRIGRADYLHLVTAVDADRYEIGNNRGRTNGWTTRQHIFGLVVEVDGRSIA